MCRAAKNMVEKVFQLYDQPFFQYMLKIGITGYWGSWTPVFWRNSHIAFQNGCKRLNFHHQWRSTSLAQYPCLYKLSLVFFNLNHSYLYKMEPQSRFFSISLMFKKVSLCVSDLSESSTENFCLDLYSNLIGLFVFKSSFLISLQILDISTLLDVELVINLLFSRLVFSWKGQDHCHSEAFQFHEILFINCWSLCLC